jgi:hypothetical protein
LDLGIEFSLMARRGTQLLKSLASNPRYILPYVKDSILNPASYGVWSRSILKKEIVCRGQELPIARRYPWFSYAANDFLESYLKPNMQIFEWGAGNSTLFFAQRCASVHSIENQDDWYQYLQKELLSNGISNVEVLMCKTCGSTLEEFEQSSYFNAIGDDFYDVIVVDGYDAAPFALRPCCFYRAEKNIKAGGVIVVDDSWRYKQLRSANSAKSIRVFESVGPARLGVTSTDFYFY